MELPVSTGQTRPVMTNAELSETNPTRSWTATLICLLALCPLGLAETVTVRVYDYAGMEPGNLAKAKDVASSILERAGIDTVWASCRTSMEEPPKDAACEKQMKPTDLMLRIVPESMARRVGRKHQCVGYAVQTGNGLGSIAAVYHHRVLDIERGTPAPRFAILGIFMAHELGHLLLPGEGHSKGSVMQAWWAPESMARAVSQAAFTSRQSKKMRANVRDRLLITSRREQAAPRLSARQGTR